MEPDGGDSQRFWRETARRFLDTEAPIAHARSLAGDHDGYDRRLYRRMGELGWMAPMVPEALGGGSVSGRPVADLAVVAEELGRTLTPAPVLEANLAAAALRLWGSVGQRERFLPDLLSGDASAAVASAGPAGDGWNESGAGLRARSTSQGWTLDGTRCAVAFGHSVDLMVVTAATPDGVVVFLVGAGGEGLRRRRLESFDLTRPLSEVDFEGVQLDAGARLAGGPADASAVEPWLALAAALQAAETAGALGQAFEITLGYAKARRAFGRAIGSFQAVKHRLADMALWLEWVRAAAGLAVEAADRWLGSIGDGSPPGSGTAEASGRGAGPDPAGPEAVARAGAELVEAASVAKSVMGEYAPLLVRSALQVHGGIGYTWEHDIHLYLRRAEANAALWGTAAFHRERLARLVGFPERDAG